MARLLPWLRRHALWCSFVAALIPLLFMVGLQYTWLSRLEDASILARKAALHNYLEAAGTEVEYFYRSTAERLLNVPASLLERGDLDDIASHWENMSLAGVRRLFIVDFTRTSSGNYYLYAGQRRLTPAASSEETLAIVLAALFWQFDRTVAYSTPPINLQVSERDPNHRIVMNPLVGESKRVVGLAGLIIDSTYFRDHLLQSILEKTLPAFFAADARRDLVLAARDERQELVLGREATTNAGHRTTLRLPFVFTDWTLSVTSLAPSPRQGGGAAFTLNMTVGLILALVLLAGIGLLLWTAAKATRLSQMKADFVSNISHELRTPVASIRVLAELLRRGSVDSPEKVQEYGDHIEAESLRLSRLIDNILDVARIESRRKTFRFLPTDMREIVLSVARTFETRLEGAGFHLQIELPPAPGPLVELDPEAVSQALHNLLDNAVKYSVPPSTITMRLAVTVGSVFVSVQDRGIGIAQAERRRIFERFYRVSTGLVHDVRGSGLGLAIVEHIVQAHGGAVTVDSEVGRGSTFTLRLPVEVRTKQRRQIPSQATS